MLGATQIAIRAFWTTLVIGLALLSGGCAKSPPRSPIKQYRLHGVVVRVDQSAHLITIKHEKIEGWMVAMTMEFPVRPKNEWLQLSPGTEITATVFVQDLDYWVGDIKTQPSNQK